MESSVGYEYQLCVLLIQSFPPFQCKDGPVVAYLKRVIQSLPLLPEQQKELQKIISRRAESATPLLLGTADIVRKEITSLLPDIKFSEYIKNMHQPEQLPLLEEIDSFANDFNEKYAPTDISEGKGKYFHNFISTMTSKLVKIWPQKTIYELSECVECQLSSTLYDRQFPPAEIQDAKFCKRVSALDFIDFNHLEIHPRFRDAIYWQYAQEALLKMDLQKTPRDKVRCILECFKILAEGIATVQKGPVAADDIMPCIIYVVLKANPPHIYSDLQYISLFRSPDQMMCETGYFHVTLFAAVSFIENLNAQQLAITPADYKRLVGVKELNSSAGEEVDATVSSNNAALPGAHNCPKCQGLGGLGSFGACAPSSPQFTSTCPTCKGTGSLTYDVIKCPECAGKGGKSVFGFCEVHDSFFTEFCSTCKGMCYVPKKEDAENVNMPENNLIVEDALKLSSSEDSENIFQGADTQKIMVNLIACALEEKSYDSRIRCALHRVARQLTLLSSTILEIEQSIMQMLVDSMSSEDTTTSTSNTKSSFRPLKIAAAAAAGGAALALTGGLAAPLVGHFLGVVGLGAIISAMTTTTGVGGGAIASILFGAAGASITAEKMATKTAGLKQFEFTKVQPKKSDNFNIAGSPPDNTVEYIDTGGCIVKNHNYSGKKKKHNPNAVEMKNCGVDKEKKGLHAVVGVPGWENPDKEACVCGVWSKALYDTSGGYGEQFVLAWEGQHLKKLGGVVKNYKEVHTNAHADNLGLKILSKVVHPVLLSSTVIQEATVADSPWAIARDRAEKAGILLAHELLNGRLGARPITLIGVSMGARLIFCCLEELSKIKNSSVLSKNYNKDPAAIIENVVLMGAAVPADMLRWATVRAVVAGRMINCYNPDDHTLNFIYKTVHWIEDGIYSPAGVSPVPSHPQYSYLFIENINVNDRINTHMDYQTERGLKYMLHLCNLS